MDKIAREQGENKLSMDEYQEKSKRTLPKKSKEAIKNYSMGLTGEAAEAMEIVKKWSYHHHELNEEKMIEELGDCLHYAAGLCTFLGVNMSDVAQANIEKLKNRYPQGFSPEASRNREV